MAFMWRQRQSKQEGSNEVANASPQSYSYRVRVPENIVPGNDFQVNTGDGRIVRVVCPPNSSPGDHISFRIIDNDHRVAHEETPDRPTNGIDAEDQEVASATQIRHDQKEKQRKSPRTNRKYEVIVPSYAIPGTPFSLVADGTKVRVTCPRGATPGQKIRFSLPVVMLRYDTDHWTRIVRSSDSKFQWIRLDTSGEVEPTSARFDIEKSAYVRALKFSPGKDPRLRTGSLSLVRADEATANSTIKTYTGEVVAKHSDIANIQSKSFKEKVQWFRDTCGKLSIEWSDGHMRISVRRSHLLEDSLYSVMSLRRKDFKKIWRLEFIGEDAIDVGGVSREWFHLVFQDLFDPNKGLFKSSVANQACMIINSLSGYCCDDHLNYFRFAGRMLGKALFDRQVVTQGHFVQLIYKHLLGWPVQMKDLELLDAGYHKSLTDLEDYVASGMDLSDLSLDFTVMEDIMGAHKVVELIPNGSNIMLTNENISEYVDACLKYRLMRVIKLQLKELLLGFFDVIPEPLLTVFDFQELELLMCGLPHIDLIDWKENSLYTGEYEGIGPDHPTVAWFWEIVAEFDEAKKARLLQFITGTSGVPLGGFEMLQGSDGNIRNFTIQGVLGDHFPYPRAHTCFNRIDLPNFQTKEELREKLELVLTTSATGFSIE